MIGVIDTLGSELIRRDIDGEVWITWPRLGEHGVGRSEEEAKENLWASLCRYLESLEASEGRLSVSLKADLVVLRQVMKQKEETHVCQQRCTGQAQG